MINVNVSGAFVLDSFTASMSGPNARIYCTGMKVKSLQLDMCGGLVCTTCALEQSHLGSSKSRMVP